MTLIKTFSPILRTTYFYPFSIDKPVNICTQFYRYRICSNIEYRFFFSKTRNTFTMNIYYYRFDLPTFYENSLIPIDKRETKADQQNVDL